MCYLRLGRTAHIGQPLCADVHMEVHVYVFACMPLGACMCIKGGFRDIRDLVLYDVWHGMTRHAWNETDNQSSEGST